MLMADAILLLRNLEINGKQTRLISILEMRDSNFDNQLRALEITSEGLKVGEPFFEGGMLRSGSVRFTPTS